MHSPKPYSTSPPHSTTVPKVKTENKNNSAFRLPKDHLRELDRLAANRNQSKGRLAKDIVMSALMDFSRFDELAHRLTVIDRTLRHLVEKSERLKTIEAAVDRLRASLATAVTRLLVETTQADSQEVVAWTKATFGVEEDA